MDIWVIDAETAEVFAAEEESHFFDRKSLRVQPSKLTKSLSAFANADGGNLLIGVEDDGTWAGAADIEEFNGHIQALEELFPFSGDFEYTFYEREEDSTYVLEIQVQKTREIKYAHDGKAYVRRGAQNLPANVELLERLKGITTFETQRINYDPSDLAESVTLSRFIATVVPETTPEQWLRKQQLVVDGSPTVAGTILFHDEPQVHLPKASVKLYRYTTTESEGTREELAFDPITIEGPAYDVIHAAVEQTVKQVEAVPLLESGGLKAVSYPPEALHEIITNAVIHRDYSFNDDIHVRVFDNRIEIASPGRLPAHITPQNILEERFSRNPVIVRIINKFPDPPNKDVGEGLNTAFRAMRNLNLQEPHIVELDNAVMVVVSHEPLASAEDRIVIYLGRNGTINNREARELLNRPEAERSIRRLFEKLVDAGVIERVPGTTRGGSRYRLVGKP